MYRTKCLKPGCCFRCWLAEDQHPQHPFGAIPAVSRECVSKTPQPSVGCQEFVLASIAGSVRPLFSLLETHLFRRNSARLGAQFSVFFRRVSALLGVLWRLHARGEINRAFLPARGACFGVWRGGVITPSNGLDFGARVRQKTSVAQTELKCRKRRG